MSDNISQLHEKTEKKPLRRIILFAVLVLLVCAGIAAPPKPTATSFSFFLYSFPHNLCKGMFYNLGCSLHFDVPCNRGAAAPYFTAYRCIVSQLCIQMVHFHDFLRGHS